MTELVEEGVWHRHDKRTCWDCNEVGIAHKSVSLKLTEKVLCRIGWRFLEPDGRMICPECVFKRQQIRIPGM